MLCVGGNDFQEREKDADELIYSKMFCDLESWVMNTSDWVDEEAAMCM